MRAICIYDDVLISLSEGMSESALTYLLVILAFRKLQTALSVTFGTMT